MSTLGDTSYLAVPKGGRSSPYAVVLVAFLLIVGGLFGYFMVANDESKPKPIEETALSRPAENFLSEPSVKEPIKIEGKSILIEKIDANLPKDVVNGVPNFWPLLAKHHTLFSRLGNTNRTDVQNKITKAKVFELSRQLDKKYEGKKVFVEGYIKDVELNTFSNSKELKYKVLISESDGTRGRLFDTKCLTSYEKAPDLIKGQKIKMIGILNDLGFQIIEDCKIVEM